MAEVQIFDKRANNVGNLLMRRKTAGSPRKVNLRQAPAWASPKTTKPARVFQIRQQKPREEGLSKQQTQRTRPCISCGNGGIRERSWRSVHPVCCRAHGRQWIETKLCSGGNQTNQDWRGLRSSSTKFGQEISAKTVPTKKTVCDCENSEHLVNQGERFLHMRLQDGTIRGARMQVTHVRKLLTSVADMNDARQDVYFLASSQSYTVHRETAMVKKFRSKRVSEIDADVPPHRFGPRKHHTKE